MLSKEVIMDNKSKFRRDPYDGSQSRSCLVLGGRKKNKHKSKFSSNSTHTDDISSQAGLLSTPQHGHHTNRDLWTTPEDEEILNDDLQSRYRTGVGQIMFLIKHSRPDLMSAVRELSKVLGKATRAAYKELLCCAKFVIGTKNKGLRIDPHPVENEWELVVFSDSDWAGDPDDRKSVGCYIIFLNGVPIAW